MPRFYFHFSNGQGFIEDDKGVEYLDLVAARAGAAQRLRAGDMRSPEIKAAAFIEIEDEKHEYVATVYFADVVQEISENDPAGRVGGALD